MNELFKALKSSESRHKQCVLLLLLCLLFSSQLFSQRYSIGEVVEKIEPEEMLSTKPIPSTEIIFVEKGFQLRFNKNQVIASLKIDSANADDSEDKAIYEKAIKYITSKHKLRFKHLIAERHYTRIEFYLRYYVFPPKPFEKMSPRRLSKEILIGGICSLIENGLFEGYTKNKKMEQYFFKRVNCYQGNVKGVFFGNKQFVWICYPIIVD